MLMLTIRETVQGMGWMGEPVVVSENSSSCLRRGKERRVYS